MIGNIIGKHSDINFKSINDIFKSHRITMSKVKVLIYKSDDFIYFKWDM